MVLDPGNHPSAPARIERLAHREFLMLGVLTTAAVLLFVATRAMSNVSHRIKAEAAAAWYATGRGDLQDAHSLRAVDAFRKAAVNDPRNKTYALALAEALDRTGDAASAEAVLYRLREAMPEDAAVNLQLARIAASRHDVTASSRLFRNALYGQADDQSGVSPTSVRIELAKMLIDNGQPTAAASELMIAALDGSDPAQQSLIGRMLLTTGEYERAENLFVGLLSTHPRSVDALVGAAEASFHRAAYQNAARYFERAAALGPLPDAAAFDSVVTQLVVALDPMAPRLTDGERRRRLGHVLTMVDARIAGCASDTTSRPSIQSIQRSLTLGRDPDVIEHGLGVVADWAAHDSACGAADAEHAALTLIARTHAPEIR